MGGVNETSGLTKTLSDVLNGTARHIGAVATVAGVLTTVGVAWYFDNMVSGAVSVAAELVTVVHNGVALAEM